jgi:hypothetical protein
VADFSRASDILILLDVFFLLIVLLIIAAISVPLPLGFRRWRRLAVPSLPLHGESLPLEQDGPSARLADGNLDPSIRCSTKN